MEPSSTLLWRTPMIRFLDDWRRFPRATVHLATKNESFKRLAALYKKMGVKNYYFILALEDPDLTYVDPHDSENLTEDIKEKIAVEAKFNVWYFLREVIRIPPATGNTPVPYRANRGNIALTWAFACNVDIALIQPRQTGKSVSTDSLMIWLLFFGLNNTTISLITKDDKLRVANIERLKKIRDLLPAYLWVHDKLDANNQTEVTYRKLTNKYITSVAQNSETAANNVARGNTVPITHNDEGPFINFIDQTLPAALAAGTAVREEAERNGTPYGNIFTTTAGKKDDRSGAYMYDLIHGGAPWDEKFFDAEGREDLWRIVKANCRNRKMIINCTMSHRQLGYTDEWLYAAISNVGGTEEQINRDFFNVWSSGSEGSPLSAKLNEIIAHSAMDPLHQEISTEGFITRWYIPETHIDAVMNSSHFVIGLDPSEAIGRDDIGMVVIDVRTLGVVAAGVFNDTTIINFSHYLGKFMTKYKNTILVIERKSTGSAITGHLCMILPERGIDPFRRIYNHVVDNQYERIEDFRAASSDMSRRGTYFYDRYVKDFGFVTTGDRRTYLYSQVLLNAAKKGGHLVRDKLLIGQIGGLVVKKGRIDHGSGEHDDLVIAWLLACWFLTDAKHIEHYGINIREVMSLVSEETRTLTVEEIREKEAQKVIKGEIETLLENLSMMTDEMMIARTEHRLRYLVSQIKSEDDTPLSVSDMLAAASDKRRMRFKLRTLDRREPTRSSSPYSIGGDVHTYRIAA